MNRHVFRRPTPFGSGFTQRTVNVQSIQPITYVQSVKSTLGYEVNQVKEALKPPVIGRKEIVKEQKHITKTQSKRDTQKHALPDESKPPADAPEEEPKKKPKPADALKRMVLHQLDKEKLKQIETKVGEKELTTKHLEPYLNKISSLLGAPKFDSQEVRTILEKWGSSIPRLAKSIVNLFVLIMRKQLHYKIKLRSVIERSLIRKIEESLVDMVQGGKVSQEHFEKIKSGLETGIKGTYTPKEKPTPSLDAFALNSALQTPSSLPSPAENQLGTTM